eukprot:358376-Pleurochrysis_carterae.AAC.1
MELCGSACHSISWRPNSFAAPTTSRAIPRVNVPTGMSEGCLMCVRAVLLMKDAASLRRPTRTDSPVSTAE